MGNTRQALKLIMENLEEVNKAIDFCKEHDDRDLWHDLIQHSLDKPSEYKPYFTLLNEVFAIDYR
jgi:hypothetical protein